MGRRRRKIQRQRERKLEKRVLINEIAKWEREHKGKNESSLGAEYTEVLKSQGQHEAELILPESDLQNTVVCCEKNPGHGNFIPAKKFQLSCLPREFQNRLVCECVKRLITLCVILRVGYTSERRPPNYDFHELGGRDARDHRRLGSGGVFIPRRRPKGQRCPCQECKNSPTPSKTWYFVWVSTALHVVYDDLEAAKTEVELYFDDDDDRTNTRRLQGLRLVNFDPQSDRSIVECVTHDREIYKSILTARSSLKSLEDQLATKYERKINNGVPLLAVLVSHPHGCSKQISFGTDVFREHAADNCPGIEWTMYTYNAASCRGSSGALVWLLGQTRVGYRDKLITTHTHSGALHGAYNTTGRGLDFVPETAVISRKVSLAARLRRLSFQPPPLLIFITTLCFMCSVVFFVL